MALVHWWPLNGNTRDYGINPITLGTIGTISYVDGKIGTGLSCTGSNGLYFNGDLGVGNTHSISSWFYVPANQNNGWGAIAILVNNGGDADTKFGLYANESTSSLVCQVSANGKYYSGIAYTQGVWHNLISTYDGTTLKGYLDGVLVSTTTITDTELVRTHFSIGCRSNSTSGANAGRTSSFVGTLNDIRIYDHALTPKEVKEISKALVLHYDFEDEEIEGTTNLADQGGCGGWNNSGTATWNSTDSISGARTSGRIVSVTKETSGNSAITFGSATATSLRGKVVTASTYIYLDGSQSNNVVYLRSTVNNNKAGDQIFALGYNGNTSPSTWPKNQWIYISGTGTVDDAETSVYFCTYVNNSGEKRAFNGWQIEEKDHPTTYVNGTRQSGVSYDASGFCNDSIATKVEIVPMITTNSTIGLGNHCARFNGSDSYVQTPSLYNLIHDGIYTINLWFNVPELGSKSWGTYYGGPSGFEFSSKRNSTPTVVAYSWGQSSSGGYEYDLNKWYMLTFVRTSSESKWYINGTLFYTGSAGSIPSGNYFIGSWRDISSQNYKGYIADFKIYATALSATDVLKEYQALASLDKNYNLYSYVFNEDKKVIDYSFMANKAIENQESFGGNFNAVTESNYYTNYPQPNNNALGTYTQSSLSVTMTDQGVRIYSPPNITYSNNNNVMWGGLCWSPMKTYKDCLKTGHRYRLEYHIKGQSTRKLDGDRPYFTNMVGWGQSPDAAPTTNSYKSPPANFNGEMDCYWDFTISDTVFKTTGSSVHSGFTANTSYLAYSSIKIGYTYASTGTLGTDVYITNLRLYDITSGDTYFLNRNGVFDTIELDETDFTTNFKTYNSGRLVARQFYEK